MKIKNIQKVVCGAFISATLLGCGSTSKVDNSVDIVSNSQYIVNIPDADIMPSKEILQGRRIKVVVLPTRNKSEEKFETGAVREVSSKVENGLINAGVEIVDRTLATHLNQEILAYEVSGKYSGSGLDLADIAILPSVNNVQIASGYSPARTYQKDGKSYSDPASCDFESRISGNVKLYQLPELSIIDAIALEGEYTNSSLSGDRNCSRSSSLDSSLASSAAQNAVNNAIHKIQSHMSGTGYVIEYRKREKDHLIQINAGSTQGIKTGQKMQFIRKIKNTNRLSGKVTIMEIPYDFTGVVSNLVEPNSAWIIVDEEAETQLKFGDVAKQLFEEKSPLKGVTESIGNIFKF